MLVIINYLCHLKSASGNNSFVPFVIHFVSFVFKIFQIRAVFYLFTSIIPLTFALPL